MPRNREYDLRDRDAIVRLYKEVRPSLVIHLAAVVGGIGANRVNSGKFFHDNAVMGIQLLEYARQFGVKKFVAVGTVCAVSEIYAGPISGNRSVERLPQETNAPYGLAKKMMLVQAQAYWQQYGFNAIYLLPANSMAQGTTLICKLLTLFLRLSESVPKPKKDNPRRSLSGAMDRLRREIPLCGRCAAEAIVLATERFDGAEPVNLGTGERDHYS